MATPLYPVTAIPFEGPPGYTGGVFTINVNQGAGNNNAAAASNGAYTPQVSVNPQQLAATLGALGVLAAGGPGAIAGLAPLGALAWYSGLAGSGFHPVPPPPPNCMTCPQINNAIFPSDCITIVYFVQAFCTNCPPALSAADSPFSGGPDASNMVEV